jgi:hypothetical protein
MISCDLVGAIESLGSNFFSGILASVNYVVCWFTIQSDANQKPRKNKTRSCLLVCTMISCAYVCVPLKFFFFPI